MTGRGMTPAGILMGCLCVLTSVFRFGISFRVLSRVMRKFVCRLRLNEVSQQ